MASPSLLIEASVVAKNLRMEAAKFDMTFLQTYTTGARRQTCPGGYDPSPPLSLAIGLSLTTDKSLCSYDARGRGVP